MNNLLAELFGGLEIANGDSNPQEVTPYFQYGLPLSYYAKGKSLHIQIPDHDTGRTLEGECEKS